MCSAKAALLVLVLYSTLQPYPRTETGLTRAIETSLRLPLHGSVVLKQAIVSSEMGVAGFTVAALLDAHLCVTGAETVIREKSCACISLDGLPMLKVFGHGWARKPRHPHENSEML